MHMVLILDGNSEKLKDEELSSYINLNHLKYLFFVLGGHIYPMPPSLIETRHKFSTCGYIRFCFIRILGPFIK